MFFHSSFHQNLIFHLLTAEYLHTIISVESATKKSGSFFMTCPHIEMKDRGTQREYFIFLTPKSEVAYIFEDETLRQTVEKMEHRKFSCIPPSQYGRSLHRNHFRGRSSVGAETAEYHGCKGNGGYFSIMTIPRRATYKPVHADADMEDLLDRAINQNYVPVIDDQGFLSGSLPVRKSSNTAIKS